VAIRESAVRLSSLPSVSIPGVMRAQAETTVFVAVAVTARDRCRQGKGSDAADLTAFISGLDHLPSRLKAGSLARHHQTEA